jgi:hypothetical protein
MKIKKVEEEPKKQFNLNDQNADKSKKKDKKKGCC